VPGGGGGRRGPRGRVRREERDVKGEVTVPEGPSKRRHPKQRRSDGPGPPLHTGAALLLPTTALLLPTTTSFQLLPATLLATFSTLPYASDRLANRTADPW
jgi:hypothetical protein